MRQPLTLPLKITANVYVTGMWNNSKTTLSDSQLIKQWRVCQTILWCYLWINPRIEHFSANLNLSIMKDRPSITIETDAKDVPFLSLDVWAKLYYLMCWEESGRHRGTRGTRNLLWLDQIKSHFALPAYKHKFHKEIRIRSDGIWKTSQREERNKSCCHLLHLVSHDSLRPSSKLVPTCSICVIKSQVDSSTLDSVGICDVITQTMFKGHWGHIWHRWLKTAWGLLKQKH